MGSLFCLVNPLTTNSYCLPLQPQILPPPPGTPRVQVQVRRLAERADAVPGAGPGVVVGGAVPGAPVVPDGEVVGAPPEADLGVVVLGDEAEEVREEEVGLVAGDAVEALGEALVDVDGLPACDGFWGGLRC